MNGDPKYMYLAHSIDTSTSCVFRLMIRQLGACDLLNDTYRF